MLNHEIKTMIIETLHLEDLTPADIEDSAPLFGQGLGLDSIDALELGVAIQKRYGIKISSDDTQVKEHFASIETLAAFISARRSAP